MARPREPERSRSKGIGGRVALLLFLLAVALLGLVALRAYRAQQVDTIVAEIPLLTADRSPTRQRPDDPGGMDVPHQKVTIFHDLEGENADPVVERLLPLPEEPMPLPADVVEPEPETKAVRLEELPPVLEQAAPDNIASETDRPIPAPPPPPPPQPEASANPPSPPATLASEIPTPPNPARGYRVQLGAFRTAEDASRGWREAIATAGGLLDPFDHYVMRIDLGEGKGIFHRLQAGPLPSRASADSLCNQLKTKKVDCFIVSP
ncbi:MAG: SPOR domain-containing protein [Alphaproteobacteria bacterium]